MTEQVIDTLIYNRQEYPIIAISGRLPIPEDFGMKPVFVMTSCYRGFYSRYICEEKLFLDEMTLRTRDDNYSQIGNFLPYRNFRDLWGMMTFDGLHMPINFTGGLVIGIEFRKGTGSIYPGSWRSYSKSLELIFEEGNLKDKIDRSEIMLQFPDLPNDPGNVEWSFTLEYDFYYPLTLRIKDES